MYIKKLEIQGFKSFADKTILEFMPGITAVIGPNGSGKSNISDAMRWVLGEQSIKSLRGGKMEDIIFTGTLSRKPLNFAEVSLTIDNSDKALPIEFPEVIITRRVYRTGESEFYINKSSCRLKDINDLFMGTGIGKDGYSIIGQGRIDEILSNNSLERRNVFEEAAGISKYKARKTEAEKNLESTHQNLLRITDILSELEGQIGPLENQSEKAQKYLTLREELKTLEINNFINSTKNLEENIELIESHLKELHEELDIKLENSNNTYLKKENFKKMLSEILINLDEIKNCIFNDQTFIEKFSSEIAILTEKSQNNSDNISRLGSEIEEFKDKISALSNEKAVKENKICYLKEQKITYSETLSSKEKELNSILTSLSAEEQRIENIKSDIIENMNLISDKKVKLNGFLTMLSNATSRREHIDKETFNSGLESDKLNIQIEDIKEKLSSVSKSIEKDRQQLASIIGKKSAVSTLMSELRNKNYAIHSELNLKKSRYKFLTDTEKENEGYFKSVKSILDECSKNPEFSHGIHGSLAQLITVPEKFEAAIEAVLGATLQNIVTDTRNDAKKAIDLLKANHTGRATFLPISSIKSHFSNLKDFSRFAGCFGIASDLINFDNKYLEIIKSLLGNTLIVDTLDTAIKIAKETTDSFKIVSLEGDIVNTIGTMSGGSQKVKTDNLLSRKRNISSLEAEIKDIESSILTNESEYSKLSLSEESLSKDAECISAVIKDNEILIAGENEKLYSLESSFAAIGEKVKYFAIEKKELSEQIETFNKDSDDIKESIAELEKVIASYQTEVDQYKIKNKSQMEIRDNLNLDITNYKVSVSSFDENISAIDETLERINADMDSLTKSIEKKEALRERLSSEIEAITINIDNTQNKIEEVKLQISESQKKLDELSAQKASVERELVSLEETALEDSRKADETKEKISNSEIKKARLDMEFDNISNKMWEDYQITYADALKLKNDSVNNLPSKINSLKSQIKALGSINIDSIEEYKTVSERFKFMSAQKEDLDQSEARLHKIITDMTVTMKEEFLKKFKIINAHFGEVFSELFGGGQALIKLADESNILESGIDIDVQPPGKKLQNMMLLSGGERAFTAIALLFAILKINPSPFCLLDEIEAALDDVNVYRFADYVKKFSDNIQFIIITHRKGTMESADSIYGVTMEERGISKLISMKLN